MSIPRLSPRGLDPDGGQPGDAPIIDPTGKTVGWGPAGSMSNEEVRDLVAGFLTAGSNVTLTHDDGADTLTIDAVGGSGSSIAAGATESHFDFFGPESRLAEALTQASTGGYVWPGSALTSSTHMARFDLGLANVLSATWRLVWTPNDAANGMRLVHADNGPTNITQIAELTGNAAVTPVHQSVDVTASVNALIDAGVFKQFGHQINAGATGPVIFMSRLELVWEGAALTTGGGAGELLMQDGVSAPPVPLENEARNDWLYEG